MPINELIARGVTPLGEGVPNVLFQIAQLREAKARDAEFARRTQLYEDNAAFERERQTKADTVAEQGRLDAERRQRLKDMWPALKAGDPAVTAEAIAGIEQHNPQLAAAIRQNPALLPQIVEGMIGAPGEPEFKMTPQGGEYAVQDGKVIGSPHYPQQFAPDRPPQPQQQIVTDGLGRQYTIDMNSPNPTPRPLVTGRNVAGPRGGWIERQQQMTAPPSATRSQIVNDPVDGPMEIIQTPNGPMRRPIPMEGAQQGGQQGGQPKTGVSKSGRPIVFNEQTQRWEYQ